MLPVAEEPTLACSELSETPRGSTRLSSPIALDQSKRESISCEIVCRRCSRICMKLVYGVSCAACACTVPARAVSFAASALLAFRLVGAPSRT